MLETRTPPDSNRTRRLDALPRSASRDAADRRPAVPGGVTSGNVVFRPAPSQERPAARPAASPRARRMGRAEVRLMGLATTCTAVVCGLLLVYLAAYARVTRLGIDQAEAHTLLVRRQLQNEMLRAERDRLQSPQRVVSAATALGMTPRGATRVNYISVRKISVRQTVAGQGMNGGTNPDGLTAAPVGY